MNKSHHSYNINNKITSLFDNNSLFNKRCFIIGVGESLENFDFSCLKNEFIITLINLSKFAHIQHKISYGFYFLDLMKKGSYDPFSKNPVWDSWISHPSDKVFLTPYGN
jgi:hypothetical protein